MSTINTNELPQVYRQGLRLKERYFSVRSAFPQACNNWTSSGQDNRESNEFYKFVPPTPGSLQLSCSGRCCLVMFHVMRRKATQEDTEALNFTCRLAPCGSGYDGDSSAMCRGM